MLIKDDTSEYTSLVTVSEAGVVNPTAGLSLFPSRGNFPKWNFFFPGSLFLYQPTDFVFRCSARTSFPGAAYFPPQRSCTYMALHQRTSRSRSNYVGITKVTECLSRDQRKICCTSLMNVVRYNSLSDSDNFLFVLYVLL